MAIFIYIFLVLFMSILQMIVLIRPMLGMHYPGGKGLRPILPDLRAYPHPLLLLCLFGHGLRRGVSKDTALLGVMV